jgi:hypothetical protein
MRKQTLRFHKLLGIPQVATQLVASRVVLISIELVSYHTAVFVWNFDCTSVLHSIQLTNILKNEMELTYNLRTVNVSQFLISVAHFPSLMLVELAACTPRLDDLVPTALSSISL